MKRQNMQDERDLEHQRKVSSEVDGILMTVLLVSTLVQQFYLNAPFKQYAVEYICFLGISSYKLVRYITMGLDINSEGKRAKIMPLINSLVAGITVTVINGISNYTRYAEYYIEDGIGYFIAVLAVTFISATVFCFIVMSFINHLNKIKQDKIQKRLDKDEENQ